MKKIVKVGNVECGAEQLFLIAGPCVVEDEKTMMDTAEFLVKLSAKLDLPLIFKSSFQKDNRSNIDFYSGPGMEKGLSVLKKIKEQFKVPILTDIHYPEQIIPTAEVADVIQIPAYLVMQTTLVVQAAKTGRALNLKHGQFLAPENMIKPIQKAEQSGNERIMVTERGYTFGYNDLVVDPRSFYHLRSTGYPVIFDVTHSIRRYGIPSSDPKGGSREFIPTIARSGVAAGIDGLFIEVHPDPSRALCDAASQMCISDVEDFLRPLMEIHNIEVKYRPKYN
jgi:2-dehydro-3-deoxyphosphooctonate aldolase (KDO 8-P synthase)